MAWRRFVEFCNAKWAGVEQRNRKIIPRVYLYWPEKMYWPADLNPGEYGSRKFLHRLGKFIAKLGQAWNRDPRVAYVETGIVGPCGEQWGPTPHFELRKVLGDSYRAAFPDKLCLIRYPWQWLDYSFGVFWDSWGTHKDTARMLEVLESPALADSWKTRVRGGEISYGFGEPPGDNPNDTMAKSHHVDWIECLVRRGHWNHLGWVSYYDWKKPVAAAHGQRLQKVFGHRFVIEEVSYPARGQAGSASGNQVHRPQHRLIAVLLQLAGGTEPARRAQPPACLAGDLRRRGRSPMAARRPLEQFADWNAALGRYTLDDRPAQYQFPRPNPVRGRFTLPRDLRRGRYVLALAILDPAGMTPACRFAIDNYFTGGRHPIGRIGVGRELDDAELDPSRFDDMAADQSLGYGVA